MLSTLLDEDSKKTINGTIFQIKCYLLLVILLLITIIYYLHIK